MANKSFREIAIKVLLLINLALIMLSLHDLAIHRSTSTATNEAPDIGCTIGETRNHKDIDTGEIIISICVAEHTWVTINPKTEGSVERVNNHERATPQY